jgi:nitrogen fixation-related uncharacterized protein
MTITTTLAPVGLWVVVGTLALYVILWAAPRVVGWLVDHNG